MKREFDLEVDEKKEINKFKSFELRVWAETDVEAIINGILPKEALFNPDYLISKIKTKNGEVRVNRISSFSRAMNNIFLGIIKAQKFIAKYTPSKREIKFVPELSKEETLKAISNSDEKPLNGYPIAHESLHAHQDINHERITYESAKQTFEKSKEAVKNNTKLSLPEAIALEGRSRDLAIVTETQSFILDYMLAGPAIGPEVVLRLIEIMKEDEGDNDWKEFAICGVKLGNFPENGVISVVDFVVDSVKSYLPKTDQDNKEYIQRISGFCKQIVKALYFGLSHLEIAQLISENHDSINSEWNEDIGGYNFLHHVINRLQDEKKIDVVSEETMIKKFDNEALQRLKKIASIAREVLSK